MIQQSDKITTKTFRCGDWRQLSPSVLKKNGPVQAKKEQYHDSIYNNKTTTGYKYNFYPK